MSDDVRTFTVDDDDDGIRLDRWFKRHLPQTSYAIVAKWARTGQLRVDGGRAAPGDRIEAGQEIRVPPDSDKAPPTKPKRKVELSADEIDHVRSMVVHKTDDAFILNKPPGLATQGGTKTTQHLDRLLNGLDEDDKGKPKLVHRLDKDTSGALLVARSARAAAIFSRSFAGRTAKKVYWAVVMGIPDVSDGIIDLPLAKQPGTGGEKMHVDFEEGAPAKTKIRVIDRAGNRAAFVELQPMTGRTHQLRAHMAAVGHPIVGDAKYGGAEAMLTGGVSRKLHLHARRLRIDAPGGGKIDQRADLPDHFAATLEGLGFDRAMADAMPLNTPDPHASLEAKIKRKKAAVKDFKQSQRRARKGPARGGKNAPGGKLGKKSRPQSKGAKKGPKKGPGRGPRK